MSRCELLDRASQTAEAQRAERPWTAVVSDLDEWDTRIEQEDIDRLLLFEAAWTEADDPEGTTGS